MLSFVKENKMRLLGNRLLVREKRQSVTSGGIIIPSIAINDNVIAEVVNAGSKSETVVIGDTVLFNRRRSETVGVDGEELLILKETDILYIL